MNFSSFMASLSLVLWGVAFLYFRSYIKKRTSPERILGEFQEEVSKMVSEIDAATDRDITLVEDRVKVLRSLLEDTDRRLVSHKRELERRGEEERAYAELGRRSPRPTPSREAAARGAAAYSPDLFSTATPPPVAVQAVPDVALPPQLPPEPLSAPLPRPRFVRSESPIEPKPLPFGEQVAALHRSGFSAELISSNLKASLSEVELAIALNTRMEEDHGSDTGH